MVNLQVSFRAQTHAELINKHDNNMKARFTFIHNVFTVQTFTTSTSPVKGITIVKFNYNLSCARA